ncbi:uncharacterized protein LOC120073693 [Benincasa hispida]|uniref:uncharacterized protein LOC120073693 n=1 Tax=Benincasa hispida TaxID=102211 RepID=UPI0019006036|nr:uncharacterized protein LOC120073693 [Benincasa hispida]
MWKDWAQRLDEALWAYRTAYKMPIGMSPYSLVVGKACHLLIKLKHKEFCAVKKLNMNPDATGVQRKLQLNELKEWRMNAYENNKIYKEKTKRWHDQRISKKGLKSRWCGPFIIKMIFPYGTVELMQEDGTDAFKVNDQRVKPYLENEVECQKSTLALCETS